MRSSLNEETHVMQAVRFSPIENLDKLGALETVQVDQLGEGVSGWQLPECLAVLSWMH